MDRDDSPNLRLVNPDQDKQDAEVGGTLKDLKEATKVVMYTDGPIITPDEEDFLVSERQLLDLNVVQQSKRIFEEAAPAAAKSIVMLAKHGANERTRFAASQYVIERVLGRVQDDPPKLEDDPYTAIIREIVGITEGDIKGQKGEGTSSQPTEGSSET